MLETESATSSRISELTDELRALQHRVALLEQHLGFAPLSAPTRPEARTHTDLSTAAATTTTSLIPVLGRALLGLAGAYLLRGAAEANWIRPAAGAAATILYAAWWLYSVRRAALQSTTIANIHCVTAAAILYPMLWEITLRFAALPHAVTAAILAAFAAAGLAIAWKPNLSGTVWITTLASVGTAFALLFATRDLVPFTAALILITATIEFCATRDHWTQIRGIVAIAADLAVLLVLYLITQPQGLPEGYSRFTPAQAVLLAVALLAVSLGATIIRTIVRSLDITTEEVFQLGVAVLLAIGGSLRVANITYTSTLPVALVALTAGAISYLVAFTWLDRDSGKNRNFYIYSTFALLLVLAGSLIWLTAQPLAAFWVTAATACLYLGNRAERHTVSLHGAIYLVLAFLASGSLARTLDRILETIPIPFTSLDAITLAGAAAATAALWLSEKAGPQTFSKGYLSFAVVALLFLAIAGLLAGAVAKSVPDLTLSVPLRTALLTTCALALALTGNLWRRGELLWLVYPWMVLTGYKLLAQDFSKASAAGFAISLVFFGGALMLIPRWLRSPATQHRSAAA